MTELALLAVIGTTVWVAFDAAERDWSGNSFADRRWKWALGCLLLWIVAFPAYLVQRTRVPARRGSSTPAPSVRPVNDAPNRHPGLFWWGIGSGAAMLVGAFGPWANVFGVPINGLDAPNDGWVVVALALVALVCIVAEHRMRALAVGTIVVGVIGAGVTLYDRRRFAFATTDVGDLGAVVTIGWGLDLALAASVSLALYGLVAATRSPAARERVAGVSATAFPSRARRGEPAGPPLPPSSLPSPVALPAPGWYADPHDPTFLRYWTGRRWGDQTVRPASP
jgi:hypothetical protein